MRIGVGFTIGSVASVLARLLPAFNAAPSISPSSGVAGTTFTATDGMVSNGSVVSRRWLLGGVVIGSGLTVVPGVAGALVLENTAVGVGETTVTTSAPVAVAAPSSVSFTKVGPIGGNLGEATVAYFGEAALLDRSRAAGIWLHNDNDPTLVVEGVDGYPVSSTGGNAAFALMPFDNPADFPGVPTRYALVTSWTTCAPFVDGDTSPAYTTQADGRLRYEFDVTNRPFRENRELRVFVNNVNAHPWVDGTPHGSDGTDPFYVVRLDQEALYKSGRRWNDDQVNTTKSFGCARFMQIGGISGDYAAVTSVAQILPMSFSRWSNAAGIADQTGAKSNLNNNRVRALPLTAQINLANEAGVSLWANMQWAFANGEAAKFVRSIKAQLISITSPVMLELGNEPWNTANPYNFGCGYYRGYRQSIGRQPLADNNSPQSGWLGYGYRSAQLAAEALKEDGYTGRFRPVLNVLFGSADCSEGTIAGVQQAIAEWNDPNDAFHNPEFATRFKEPGQLFTNFAVAPYMDGGLTPALSSADLATVDGWADATDDSGLASYFDQLLNGGHLPSAANATFINTLPQVLAAQQAVAVKYQMPLITYEAQIATQAPPTDKAAQLVARAALDPRMQPTIIAFGTKLFEAGVELIMQFTEYCPAPAVPPAHNAGQQPFGSKAHLSDNTAPRYLGYKALQANPPAPAALAVALKNVSSYTAGTIAKVVAQVTGGRGRKTLVWNGLASGWQADGFRNIQGTLTTSGVVQGSVYAIDEFGNQSPAVTFDQNSLVIPVTTFLTPAPNDYTLSNGNHTATGGQAGKDGFIRAATTHKDSDAAVLWLEAEYPTRGEVRFAMGLVTDDVTNAAGLGDDRSIFMFAQADDTGYFVGNYQQGPDPFSTDSGLSLGANRRAMLINEVAGTVTFYFKTKKSNVYPLANKLKGGVVQSAFMQLGAGDVGSWTATSVKEVGSKEWG